MKKYLFFTCVLIASVEGNAADGTTFHYPNTEANEEFPQWGGLCDKGNRQSPINLSKNGAFKSDFEELKFVNYEKKLDDIRMLNNGHTVLLNGFPTTMKMKGGLLEDAYVVEQIHFHWWSEHTIDNMRYPLECHIVHRNPKYDNFTVAMKHEDGVGVLAILYHVSNTPNMGLNTVIKNIDKVKKYEDVKKPVKIEEFTVSKLFPKVEGYFTYNGSLTTPTCDESVKWVVLHSTFPVTLDQVEKFKEIEYEKDKQLRNNYRNIQKSNNRVVISYDNVKDSGSRPHTSLGIVMALMVIGKSLL